MSRPSWHAYFAQLAQLAATRATCPRRHVGCVLVRHNRVITTGYNGALAGAAQCDEVGCFTVDGHCVRTTHAELNAIADAAARGVALDGATACVTLQPCWGCLRSLVAAGVTKIYYTQPYGTHHALYAKVHAQYCEELQL